MHDKSTNIMKEDKYCFKAKKQKKMEDASFKRLLNKFNQQRLEVKTEVKMAKFLKTQKFIELNGVAFTPDYRTTQQTA